MPQKNCKCGKIFIAATKDKMRCYSCEMKANVEKSKAFRHSILHKKYVTEIPTKMMIEELKARGLDVHALNMPFLYHEKDGKHE